MYHQRGQLTFLLSLMIHLSAILRFTTNNVNAFQIGLGRRRGGINIPSVISTVASSHRQRRTLSFTTVSRWLTTTNSDEGQQNQQQRQEQEDDFVTYQSSVSQGNVQCTSEEEHLSHQQTVFDTMSEWFADREKEVTPDLEPIYQVMANDILQQILAPSSKNSSIAVLDVACGTGVLWEFLLEAANQANVSLRIQGVDLSPAMVEHASKRAKRLLDHHQTRQSNIMDNSLHPCHTIDIVASDIIEYCRSLESSTYDGVILNACFGNFYNPRSVLEALPGPSMIAISHPLGAPFVQKLHNQDPKTVPHLLPTTTLSMVQQWTHGLPILPTYFAETPYYLMMVEKQVRRAKALPIIQRYRGKVDQGYGRGGKKLGVPTANLPSSLFQNALQDVGTGVYFGWAVLEHLVANQDQPQPFKAVVNVGYSPTFQGQENKEKIIEAHLILDDKGKNDNAKSSPPLADFYGQVMRIQLSGYLRDEQKFDSFPQLIAQIHADIDDAREALDLSPFVDLQSDPFLALPSSSSSTTTAAAASASAGTMTHWVGQGGGDETASWEFVNLLDLLTTLVKTTNK